MTAAETGLQICAEDRAMVVGQAAAVAAAASAVTAPMIGTTVAPPGWFISG